MVGNLGKDPELLKTPSGISLCKFTMATTERYKNKQGEQQNKTEWHNIVVWGGLAETCGKTLVVVNGDQRGRTCINIRK